MAEFAKQRTHSCPICCILSQTDKIWKKIRKPSESCKIFFLNRSKTGKNVRKRPTKNDEMTTQSQPNWELISLVQRPIWGIFSSRQSAKLQWVFSAKERKMNAQWNIKIAQFLHLQENKHPCKRAERES